MRYIYTGTDPDRSATLDRRPDGSARVSFPQIDAEVDVTKDHAALILIQMLDYQIRGLGTLVEEAN